MRGTEVKGQVALSGSGEAGKFSWRGQTATLKEFVMALGCVGPPDRSNSATSVEPTDAPDTILHGSG